MKVDVGSTRNEREMMSAFFEDEQMAYILILRSLIKGPSARCSDVCTQRLVRQWDLRVSESYTDVVEQNCHRRIVQMVL
jgi:hypothetical protein